MSYSCPVCHRPLLQASCHTSVLLWCGHGACPSIAANDGGEGNTWAEAFADLKRKIDKEIEEADQAGGDSRVP